MKNKFNKTGLHIVWGYKSDTGARTFLGRCLPLNFFIFVFFYAPIYYIQYRANTLTINYFPPKRCWTCETNIKPSSEYCRYLFYLLACLLAHALQAMGHLVDWALRSMSTCLLTFFLSFKPPSKQYFTPRAPITFKADCNIGNLYGKVNNDQMRKSGPPLCSTITLKQLRL